MPRRSSLLHDEYCCSKAVAQMNIVACVSPIRCRLLLHATPPCADHAFRKPIDDRDGYQNGGGTGIRSHDISACVGLRLMPPNIGDSGSRSTYRFAQRIYRRAEIPQQSELCGDIDAAVERPVRAREMLLALS